MQMQQHSLRISEDSSPVTELSGCYAAFVVATTSRTARRRVALASVRGNITCSGLADQRFRFRLFSLRAVAVAAASVAGSRAERAKPGQSRFNTFSRTAPHCWSAIVRADISSCSSTSIGRGPARMCGSFIFLSNARFSSHFCLAARLSRRARNASSVMTYLLCASMRPCPSGHVGFLETTMTTICP